MTSLFEFDNQPETLPLTRAKAVLYRGFLPSADAGQLLQYLLDAYTWEQPELTVYGRKHKIPRHAAWVGDADTGYDYSGIRHQIQPWSAELIAVKQQIEALANTTFNSVLLNRYDNGLHKMGWHADDETSLGPNPIIASLNLGATRRFDLRNKLDKTEIIKTPLNNGSLLVMGKHVQRYYEHQVPQQKRVNEVRVNLTFRRVITGLHY